MSSSVSCYACYSTKTRRDKDSTKNKETKFNHDFVYSIFHAAGFELVEPSDNIDLEGDHQLQRIRRTTQENNDLPAVLGACEPAPAIPANPVAMASNLIAMASNLRAMAFNLINSDGLQPSSDGLQPKRDCLQPAMASNLTVMASNLINSDGLQPSSDGLQPKRDCLQPAMASNLTVMASNLL